MTAILFEYERLLSECLLSGNLVSGDLVSRVSEGLLSEGVLSEDLLDGHSLEGCSGAHERWQPLTLLHSAYSNMCSKHKHTYFFVFAVTGTDAKEYPDAPSLACALQHHC